MKLLQRGHNGEHWVWQHGPYESQHFDEQEYAEDAFRHDYLVFTDTRINRTKCSVCKDEFFAVCANLG